MSYMRLVNIDRLINAKIYDEKERAWKEVRMSIEALLNRSSSDNIPIIEAESASVTYDGGEFKTTTLHLKG